MVELNERETLQGREVLLGGIVTVSRSACLSRLAKG